MFATYGNYRRDIAIAVAAGLLVSIFAWSAGLRYLETAHAADLSSTSDTLSDSRPGLGANHTIQYTNATSTTAGQTITITFDPTTSLFGGIGSVATSDVSVTGMTLVDSCAGANDVTLSTSTTALTFTVCGTATVASGTKTIQINNDVITNPTSTGSYIIRLNAGGNTADTRVAIVNAVQVTAAVDTTFDFTVTGFTTSTPTLGNGATTTATSSATSLNFGTVLPNTHYELAQQLSVTTNAGNGFAVTVHEDQDMTSQNGNTIHLFDDGNATSTPSPWVAPGDVLDQSNTYGHIGITSDDADLGGGEFGTSTPLYAGSFQSTSTLTVFSHNGPADGTTQNKGKADIALRLEISPLQAAANDYTNNLIYVATPTF